MENISSSNPFFSLTVEQAETLFKSWISDIIKINIQPHDVAPTFYTRDEVCKLLHVSLPTLDKLTRTGKLQSKQIGKRYLFTREEVATALKAPTFKKYRRRA